MVGALLSLFSGKGALLGGLRMLLIGSAAAAATYVIGSLVQRLRPMSARAKHEPFCAAPPHDGRTKIGENYGTQVRDPGLTLRSEM